METSTQRQVISNVANVTPVLNIIVKQFEASVKRFWQDSQSNPEADFAHLEEATRQLSRHCLAAALQAAVGERRTAAEDEWLLGHSRCECGEVPQYKGRQKRTVQTWVGTITLERGYF